MNEENFSKYNTKLNSKLMKVEKNAKKENTIQNAYKKIKTCERKQLGYTKSKIF